MRLVLNELSIKECSVAEVSNLYESFFKMCINAGKSHNRKASIISVNRFSEFNFHKDLLFQQWVSGQTKDLKNLIISMVSKSPLILDYPYYSFNGKNSKGLGYAFENNLLAISFDVDQLWRHTTLPIKLEYIDEDSNSLVEENVEVRHAYDGGSVQYHESYLDQSILRDNKREALEIDSGTMLWTKRQELFPSLSFCSQIEQQIANFSGDLLVNLINRLIEMNHYFSNWTTGDFDRNAFGGNCRLESQTRVNQFNNRLNIACPDGEIRLFSLHCNFSLHGQRMHFVPDQTKRICWIGYIGKKIV